MHVRFFGNPWPNEDRRAPVCEHEEFRVPVDHVVGRNCIECDKPITERDRGVITACSMRIWGHFFLKLDETVDPETGEIEPAGEYPVAVYHLLCWLKEVVGGEMSAKIADRMRLNAGDKPLTNEQIDEMEEAGLSTGRETHDPGEGWFR